jgi:N-acetylglucosamine-6-phosphate deacetylase
MQSLLARHYRTGTPVRLHWEKGRIALVRAEPSAHPEAFVAPALLDIQVNGYAGWDFAAPAGLAAVAHALAAHGVARFCPTVITGPDEVLLGTLAAIDRALSSDPELAAAVPG